MVAKEGKQIKKPVNLRTRLNLSQEEIAARLKEVKLPSSVSTVSKWECGAAVPKLYPWQFRLLCEVYECTLEELVDAFPAEQTESPPSADSDEGA